jgi:hypothetical protein
LETAADVTALASRAMAARLSFMLVCREMRLDAWTVVRREVERRREGSPGYEAEEAMRGEAVTTRHGNVLV